MPEQKTQHKNWIRSHSDNIVSILRRGDHFAASFQSHDRLVVVIPVFPDGSLVMGETYRAIMDDISLEFPSATCGTNEHPDDVADRLSCIHSQAEVSERIRIGEIYTSPGYLDQMVLLYLVKVSKPQGGRMTPGKGMLSLRALSVQEISETIAKGGMADATTSACLMRYLTLNRQGEGLLPTRMRDIEILDANGEVITTIMTNRPEWSFIEFQDENPDLARDWRFKQVEDIASPTGEPIPVKSSLAMRLRRGTATPGPAFQGAASSPAQESDDAAAEDQPIKAPFFSRHRTQEVPEADQDIPEQVDEQVDEPSDVAQAHQPAPEAPAPGRSPLFRRVSPTTDHTAPQEAQEASHATTVVETPEGHIEAPQHPDIAAQDRQDDLPFSTDVPEVEQSAGDREPRRRLTLSLPQHAVEQEMLQDQTRDHSQDAYEPAETLGDAGSDQEPVHSIEAPAVDAIDMQVAPEQEDAPARRREPRLKGAWGRIEPEIASRVKSSLADVVDSAKEKKAPKAPAAPKREPSEKRSEKKDGKSGLSRLTGLIKKAVQKEEPEAPVRAPVPPHVLYGVDDAFDELTPPGPVFKPPAGWGEDKP